MTSSDSEEIDKTPSDEDSEAMESETSESEEEDWELEIGSSLDSSCDI